MLQSMTGYGDACVKNGGISVCVEIRSINNRYLKVSLRSNEALGALESQIEEIVRGYAARGSVSVSIKIDKEKSSDAFKLNLPLLSEYRRQLEEWIRLEGIDSGASMDLSQLLALPGVVEDNSHGGDCSAWIPQVRETLVLALERLREMRIREGKALAEDLLVHLNELRRRLDFIVERAPEIVKIFNERLVERLNRLFENQGVQVEPADVIREVGIFADKCDISEEISRLKILSNLRAFCATRIRRVKSSIF
ncbi:MAG: YicC/YloC family endoribonuclease [Planctomycetia bacterium]|nr:YicC/YloC family endoribonuclease [Planctomycetia bacterium]